MLQVLVLVLLAPAQEAPVALPPDAAAAAPDAVVAPTPPAEPAPVVEAPAPVSPPAAAVAVEAPEARPDTTLLRVSQGANVFLTGITAGLYVGSYMTHEEARANITPAGFIEQHTSPVNLFGTVAPLLMLSSALSAIPVMWQIWDLRDPRFWLAAATLVGSTAMLVTSVIINVPINDETATWTLETIPANYLETYDRWILGNNIRTAIALPVFASAVVGALWVAPGEE